MRDFDAVIVGGGPAGATAAILLAHAGWSVAVVEQKTFPRRKVCGEFLSATNWAVLGRLGLKDAFLEAAGPPVTSTAIFIGSAQYPAPLPALCSGEPFGRALSRERLDAMLLARAAALGAHVFQPARCRSVVPAAGGQVVTIDMADPAATHELRTGVVIAAHGSWDKGNLPTQVPARPPRGGDWLAFKAHFRNASLPGGLMPLLCFQDGYGGMVHCDDGRVSLSFCVRRRRLEQFARAGGQSAGEAALAHLFVSCPAAASILQNAVRGGSWLATGVIQPGIRPRWRQGVFVVGNAAGEAHPVVAEGISMAIQGAWLLAAALVDHRRDVNQPKVQSLLARRYSTAWRVAFAPRIYAAAAIAQWASRPPAVRALRPLLAGFPAMVTFGAWLSGKSQVVLPATPVPGNSECCHA